MSANLNCCLAAFCSGLYWVSLVSAVYEY